MKTWKHGIFGILAIIALALAFIACDDGKDNGNDDNEVKDRSVTRTLAHGVGSVTVKGIFTKLQLDEIADKVAKRINDRLNTDIGGDPDTWLAGYIELFGRGVTYIVEQNPVGYSSYKLTGDGKTVYIALDKVDTTVPANVVVDLYQRNTMVDGVAVSP